MSPTPPTPPTAPPLLLPIPVSVRRTGRVLESPPDFSAVGEVDAASGIHPQGYELVIAQSGIRLRAATPEGLRNGRATLAQLRRQYGTFLPTLEIMDEPAFASRGVMLDVSRDRVPTTPFLGQAIGLFASLKLNHLELYTEHTFAYEGHEEVWRGSSPITPDEARTLDGWAGSAGIDLVPNQNCFGHLHRWLRRARYAPLAETEGEWTFLRWRREGPFSLCPTDPASAAFVRELLGQMLPCFSSSLVNIGCDETFDVGQGRSFREVEELGRAAVYFGFVEKICAIARGLGKRPLMWADIALSAPEALHLFPKDAVGLAWGYEPDFAFGEACRRLREQGVEAWVCPGTSAWLSITGRTTERKGNLAAASAARRDGAAGYLVTDWGDYGHMQQWPVTMNAIAEAAQLAWNPGAPVDARAVSLHALGDSSPALGLGAWLDELGDVDLAIRRVAGMTPEGKPPSGPIRNNSALFLDLHRPTPYVHPVGAQREQWQDILDHLEALESSVPRQADPLLARELAQTMSHAKLAALHAVVSRGERSRSEEMGELMRHVAGEHRVLWPERSREGGLEDSMARFDLLADRLARDFGVGAGGGGRGRDAGGAFV